MIPAPGKILLFFIVSQLLHTLAVRAEPWLGSRYARNCSGCHAPQRINLRPIDRRCTLSCQGCHVNPNGGGLRSFYGKWTGNRWLKSWRSDLLSHDLNVATYPKQFYAKKRKLWSKANSKWVYLKGFPLVETRKSMNEKYYYWNYGRYKTTAKNRKHYLFQIPAKDPWRQMAQSKWDGGIDLRWYAASVSLDLNGEKSKRWVNFPMSADFGLRYRPFYRKFHMVMENRYWGSTAKAVPKRSVLATAYTRSLYAMVDDLPFNIFLMGGYYRPLFGNYDPYHYGLAQRIVSYGLQGRDQAYNIVYEALSLGTAPNVPYLNVHRIGNRVTDVDDRTNGYALNLGFRGVRYGQSLNYSYWRTKDPEAKIEVQMHSIGFLVLLGKHTLSYEGVSVARDDRNNDFRQGGVHTLDFYFKSWREFYWQSTVAVSNVSADLLPGEAIQVRTGVKAFVIPGLELSLFLEQEKNESEVKDEATGVVTKNTLKKNGISSQVHAYF